MFRKVFVLLMALGLAGCGFGPNIPTQMNIESDPEKPEFLMGEITRAGGFAFQKINFNAENLKKTCQGQSLDGMLTVASNGLFRDNYKHKFPITCSDGSKGVVMLNLVLGNGGVTGSGYGEMDDGSVIKISVGNSSGGIAW